MIGWLFDLVKGSDALSLEDVVPENTPSRASLTYDGRNSLPAFSLSRERITRTADGLLFGNNDTTTRVLTGPGCFVVLAASEGELVFDNSRPPPFEPAGWPRHASNGRGASRIVFGDTRDYVRRVADGVMEGAAFQHDLPRSMWFSLVRRR